MQTYRYLSIVALVIFTGTSMLVSPLVFGQSKTVDFNAIYFEKLGVKEGLSNNLVKCIFQDREGFLWIGTGDGLNRYDGKDFKVFRNDPANPHSISGNIITGIAEDKEGNLWITTWDGGLSSYSASRIPSQQFQQYRNDARNKNSIPANNLNALTIDRNDNIWVVSENNGVFCLNGKTKQISYISNLEKDSATSGFSYGGEVIRTDEDGHIWCGLYGDLMMRFNPQTYSVKDYLHFKTKDGKELKRGVTVHCLFPAQKNIWFAHYSTLDRYNYQSGEFEQYIAIPDKRSLNQNDRWVAMEKDVYGNIWVASRKNGCYLFDTSTKQFHNFRYDVNDPGSMSSNLVNDLYLDKAGILWIGTDNGLCKYDPLVNQVRYHFVNDPKNPSPENLNIYDFYEDTDGGLWLATDRGLYIREKNATSFGCKYSSYNGNPLIIYRFWESPEKKIYMITKGNNFLYEKSTNKLTEIPFLDNHPTLGTQAFSYRISAKTAVLADSLDMVYYSEPGSHKYFGYLSELRQPVDTTSLIRHSTKSYPMLWVGSIGWGLYRYNLEENKGHIAYNLGSNYPYSLNNNQVQAIIKDDSGKIWIATNGGGINTIKEKDFYNWNFFDHFTNDPSNPYSLSSNSISDMCLDQHGTFWITTYSGILNRFDPNAKDKKYFTHIAGTDASSRQAMFSIMPDKKNNLWITSASALLKYNIAQNRFYSWRLPEQLPFDQYPGKKYTGRDGTIYIGGNKFFYSFHPDSLRLNTVTPVIAVTSFSVLNKPSDSLLLNEELMLRHDQNFFSFEFAALNFSTPEANQFAYKLDGVDKDWVYAGSKNTATYTSVPPGEYSFHIKAANNNGVWNEQGKTITIVIEPGWWQTILFRISVLVALVAMIFLGTRYYFKQKIRLQQEQLEKQKAVENVRSRISMDIHDEIGSSLTKISLMSQRVKLKFEHSREIDPQLIDKISSSSKEVIGNLGEIIWTVNPQYDNLPSLVAYLRNYTAQFFDGTPVSCCLDFNNEIPQISIHPDIKRNLFLVIKESLNNIVKHAGATEVNIKFRYHRNKYYFEITDNGSGMEHLDGRDFGNGLLNMKSRMQNIDGNFEIVSEKNSGTTIKLAGTLDF